MLRSIPRIYFYIENAGSNSRIAFRRVSASSLLSELRIKYLCNFCHSFPKWSGYYKFSGFGKFSDVSEVAFYKFRSFALSVSSVFPDFKMINMYFSFRICLLPILLPIFHYMQIEFVLV